MSDGGDCRTAPATPGLLITRWEYIFIITLDTHPLILIHPIKVMFYLIFYCTCEEDFSCQAICKLLEWCTTPFSGKLTTFYQEWLSEFIANAQIMLFCPTLINGNYVIYIIREGCQKKI